MESVTQGAGSSDLLCRVAASAVLFWKHRTDALRLHPGHSEALSHVRVYSR